MVRGVLLVNVSDAARNGQRESAAHRAFRPQLLSAVMSPPGQLRGLNRVVDGSGVERAGEVFQAAVDLDGDHAVAGAEPAGNADGGGEVGAG
jgi:hypothetical protein